MNPKCLRNPAKDHSGRRNPVYISRVLSAMVTLIPHMCCHVFVHIFSTEEYPAVLHLGNQYLDLRAFLPR